MRKFGLAALISIMMFALTVVPANAAHAPMTTGDVYFSTPYGVVHLVFNAHQTDPAKGWVDWTRTDPYANFWSGPVVFVSVTAPDADFTVRVINGATVVVGCDITFHVHDGGEPGIGADTVNVVNVVSSPSQTCAAAGQTQGPYTIDGGNLQVNP